MHGNPVAARASAHQEGAGEGHEEHQNGNNTESDAGVVAIRRGCPGAAALVVVATVWGRGGAASSSPDVVNYEFDVRKRGCARHGDLPLFDRRPVLGTLLRGWA